MFWADFRIKVARFFRKHLKAIIIILIIWLCVLVVNNMLKNYKKEESLNKTYQPHDSVLDSKQGVPTQVQNQISSLVDEYFNYCQNKDYEKAYNMLSEGCKNVYFKTIADFQEYIDLIFDDEKAYYIQNYSNYNNYYVYQIRIFENLMKTGLTGKDEVSFYEEKIVINKDSEGNLKLSVRQYIASEIMEDIYEDNYLKIWVEKKDVFYEQEVYTVKIRNKSEYIAVLSDGQEVQEVLLAVGSQNRETSNNNLAIVLQPGDTSVYNINFTKFFDETYLTKGMLFNAVRILKTYTGLPLTKEKELKNAEKLYSIQIPF